MRNMSDRAGRPSRAAAAAPQKNRAPAARMAPSAPANPKRVTASAQKPKSLKGGGKRPAASTTENQQADQGPQRIAKVMARAGLCSRRDAEVWIGEGRVSVNGTVITQPGVNVSDADDIRIDGVKLGPRTHTRLFLFHKPRGLVTTNHDPEGRPTVFDYLHEHHPDLPRVLSIGRLDINTEGLLLLTNDGGLSRLLELPTTGWVRRYRVRANGTTNQAVLDRLREGVTIDGVDYAGIEAVLDREQGANNWLTLSLREGKNREVKRVLEHIGLAVNRLIRLSFGPFQLGELPEGGLSEVRTRVLRDQLGPSLAAAAGVDWTRHDEEENAPSVHGRPQGLPQGSKPSAKATTLEARGAPRGKLMDEKPATGRDARKPARLTQDSVKPRPQQDAPREKVSRTAAAHSRKHISTLRGEDEVRKTNAPRKKIESQDIADRNGRVVKVERHIPTASNPTTIAPTSRNAKRFAAGHAATARAERTAERAEKLAKFAANSGKDNRIEKGNRDKGAFKASGKREQGAQQEFGRATTNRPDPKRASAKFSAKSAASGPARGKSASPPSSSRRSGPIGSGKKP